ncbi:hypothetical protein F442_10151 [Phytophthora nicotianae P10297]|uniref:Uncharacterized protein n=1 Tax=Phytophthora nicotianae P10297 TaxID=1317064 RepID=W2Z6K3_PHYNI|nr:hypothetical protein F442_10151 [Phytophthora nicotianae P10297]
MMLRHSRMTVAPSEPSSLSVSLSSRLVCMASRDYLAPAVFNLLDGGLRYVNAHWATSIACNTATVWPPVAISADALSTVKTFTMATMGVNLFWCSVLMSRVCCSMLVVRNGTRASPGSSSRYSLWL